MKILIVGSGGREHALAWACSRSSLHPKITVTPGNGGTSRIARNIDISSDNITEIIDFVRSEKFDLVVIGPEAPAVAGLADLLLKRGYRVFGPSAGASRIEGSKAFSKRLMAQEGIPTAEFEVFNNKTHADDYIKLMGAPIVVKASGIAAGKGVIVCQTVSEAIAATKSIFEDKAFGSAGDEVVIEALSKGREVSMMALVDGTDYLLLPPSRDHKRVFDHDRGPNTGGMGAYSPLEDISEAQFKGIADQVLPKLLKGLENIGTPFKGALYPGLMINGDKFEVIEVNARFGDPEAQVLLPMLNIDLLETMAEIAEGSFSSWMSRRALLPDDYTSICRSGSAATIVAASKGYPGDYHKGLPISSIPEEDDDIVVFHAGTKRSTSGLVTNGGRVLSVTGLGSSLEASLAKAYDGIAKIKFDGIHYRQDIGRGEQF